jgi:hypothetical protein
LQQRGRVEHFSQRLSHPGDADIPSDVAAALVLVEAERAERARDQPPGMVGRKEEIRPTLRLQEAERGRLSGVK